MRTYELEIVGKLLLGKQEDSLEKIFIYLLFVQFKKNCYWYNIYFYTSVSNSSFTRLITL